MTIFADAVLTRRVKIPMAQIVDPRVDKKIVEVLKTAEGPCVTEGYFKKDSVEPGSLAV